MKRTTIQALLGFAILAVLAVFVWPTCYKYDHMKLDTNDFPVRINRLTGKTEILFPDGWRSSGAETPTRSQELAVPADEVAKLTGQGHITYDEIEIDLYNGSDWTISEITVLVTVLGANKSQILSRSYRLSGYGATPQSSTKFRASFGFEFAPGQTWAFSITSAKGRRE